MEVVVTTWSYKTCKAPVKSSPPTNQHPTFYRPDALTAPNQQCQSTEGKALQNNVLIIIIISESSCRMTHRQTHTHTQTQWKTWLNSSLTSSVSLSYTDDDQHQENNHSEDDCTHRQRYDDRIQQLTVHVNTEKDRLAGTRLDRFIHTVCA